MATLTVDIPIRDELLREVDECARKEERTREEIVDEAIDAYLQHKKKKNREE